MAHFSRLLSRFETDRDHIMFNADTLSAMQHDVETDLGLSTVKLGATIPHHPEGARMIKAYQAKKISLFYDLRLSYRWQQIGSAFTSLEEYGYDRISVGATGIDERHLVAAGCAAENSVVVVSISTEDKAGLKKQFSKIGAANQDLDDAKKLCWVICDSPIIEQVREGLPDFVISATGIYIPGTEPDDIEYRRTPGQARLAGADEVGLGNAITFAQDMTHRQAADAAVASWAEGR